MAESNPYADIQQSDVQPLHAPEDLDGTSAEMLALPQVPKGWYDPHPYLEATQQAGGKVVGIIPRSLAEKELARDDCDEFYLVDTMHQRKHMMAERADAFLALPGGIGTFEEFFEVWTWRQLGYHNKPIGLLNVDGYFDGLLAFMQNTVSQGFVSDWQMGLIHQSDKPQELLPTLIQAAGLAEGPSLNAI